MFRSIANLHPVDRGYPARTATLQLRRAILNGTFYDPLKYEFFESVAVNGEPILLSQRRPSVQYNLCRIVVQDSVSMLFGEGNFPAVDVENEDTHAAIQAVMKESRLPQVMAEAALCGSVGSIAILMQILDGKVYFTKLDTDYLTPEWNPKAPTELLRVTEKYKVRGTDLKARGYSINLEDELVDHWFMRQWDATAEIWFQPWPVDQSGLRAGFEPAVDETKTVRHNLGFVPMVWIKNLPGGNGIDGSCTFDSAVNTNIEIDYQLSQAGRGLKYSSEPMLLLKEPSDPNGEIHKGAGQAIVVSEHGDAKLLEISGDAVSAVVEYVRVLRELAIESIRGNRTSADKLTAAQSGRAIELLHQNLVWLTGELRVSYGENGLLPLIGMVIRASHAFPLEIGGTEVTELDGTGLALRWPPIFRPTHQDQAVASNALKLAREGGILSRESAVRIVASLYDIDDPVEELKRIEAEEEAARKLQKELGAQVQLKESSEVAPIAP